MEALKKKNGPHLYWHGPKKLNLTKNLRKKDKFESVANTTYNQITFKNTTLPKIITHI
jgi:hypothetical protein